jgi:hypothetical protein
VKDVSGMNVHVKWPLSRDIWMYCSGLAHAIVLGMRAHAVMRPWMDIWRFFSAKQVPLPRDLFQSRTARREFFERERGSVHGERSLDWRR